MDWVQRERMNTNTTHAIVIVLAIVGVVSAATGQSPDAVSSNQESIQAIVEYETAPQPFIAGASEVWDIAIAPNGQLMATAEPDGQVRLYDRASRELLQLLTCHTDSVASLEFSPDSSLLATAGYDQLVKIWRVPGLQLQKTLSGHTGRVVCTTFSPDGERLASCGYDGTIRIWQAATGEAIATTDETRATVRCVAFSQDGTTLVSGADDGLVRLWDAATLESSAQLEGHKGRVRGVAFAPLGDVLASVGEDGTTRIWDRDKRTVLWVKQFGVQAWRLAFSSAGNTLAVGYQNGSIRLFDAATGEVLAEQENHSDIVSSLDFLADDQAYFSSSFDGAIYAWNARMPAQPTVARLPTDNKVWSTAISSQGDRIAAAGRNGFVQIRELQSGNLVREFDGHPATIDRIEFSLDGNLLATASWRSAEVMVWQTRDGEQKHRFEAESNVRAVAFSPDGRHLAAACTGRQLVVWDLADGQRVSSVIAHQLPVYDVAYSPDGQTMITCSGDWTKPQPGSVKLWKAESLTEVAKLGGHETAVRSAAFRPDGKQAASASESGEIKIWDVETNIELVSLQNSAGIRAITYSSDGKLLAAALHDGTINLWDLDQEAIVSRLRGDDDMFSVRFSPDDSVVFGAGGERRFLFWDVSKLRPGRIATWVQAWPGNEKQE